MRALVAWLTLALGLWVTPAWADDALSRAEQAMQRGDHADARRALEPLVKRQRPRALVLAGKLNAQRGERAAAERLFYKVIHLYNNGAIQADDGEGLWAVAEAAWGLGAFRDANEAFARAVGASPDNVDIELAWARLFLEKYDIAQAEQGLAKVLTLKPEHPQALELLARVRLEQGAPFPEIEALLDQALALDPNLTAAHVTRAALDLRDEDLEAADRHLDAALAINPRDLEALSVRAAVRFVADDKPGFQAAVKRVLKEHPTFSRVYSIVATYAEWQHRYEELVQIAEAALKLDPEDAYAHATRGLNLLRVGREQEGLKALHGAWARDRYNVHVYNTLNLYDDVISKAYVDFDAPPFRLRTHREERALMQTYAVPLLRRAYAEMQKRYGFTPAGPVTIELYADATHFAVRTSGMPQLGVQGVCFGKVLTALSPRGGEFNWGQILWHELSHVFHVQLSKSRVPRWFTEGLAEYETKRARPEWKREDDRALYDALEAGSLPKLAQLNKAFTHARDAEALMVAYYASSVAVEYVVERFGFDKIAQMLALYAEGLPSEAVFERSLGVSLDTLDREFREHLRARLGAKYARDLRVDINRYADLKAAAERASRAGSTPHDRAAYALTQAVAGSPEAALSLASKVLAESPKEPLALFTRVHVALKRGDVEAARKALEAMLAQGHDGYQMRMLLARCEKKLGRKQEALAHLTRAEAIDPEREEAYGLMAEIAQETRDQAGLIRALTQVSRLDQHARGPLRQLLPLLAEQGELPLLLERAEAGLYLDPENPDVHRLLAFARLRLAGPEAALFEAEQAVQLAADPKTKKKAEELLQEVKGALTPTKARSTLQGL